MKLTEKKMEAINRLSLYDLTNVLSDDELENFQFIQSYGAVEFYQDSTVEDLAKLEAFYQSLEMRWIFSINGLGENILSGCSRCDGHHKRAKRRADNLRVCKRSVLLGCDDIYSEEDGRLLRSSGYVFEHLDQAQELIRYKLPYSVYSEVVKYLHKGKSLIKKAKHYEQYGSMYHSRFFAGTQTISGTKLKEKQQSQEKLSQQEEQNINEQEAQEAQAEKEALALKKAQKPHFNKKLAYSTKTFEASKLKVTEVQLISADVFFQRVAIPPFPVNSFIPSPYLP